MSGEKNLNSVEITLSFAMQKNLNFTLQKQKNSLEPPSCKTISKNFWPEFQLQYLWNTLTNFLYLYLLFKIKMLRPVGGLYDPLQNL